MNQRELNDSGIEWLGPIPADWEVRPLFTVMDEVKHKNSRGQISNVLSLSYGRIVPRNVDTNFGLLPESFDTYQIVHEGNIVLRLLDLQNDHVSLRTGLVKETGIVTSAYVALEPRETLDPAYANYLLHDYDILKVFYNFGGGVRQQMKYEDLKRLPILFPQLDEQRRLAVYLDVQTAKIERLITLRRHQIGLLREQRAALIHRAVTKGLNPRAPMKESGLPWLGEIPEHWEVIRLKTLSQSIIAGPFGSSLTKDMYVPSGYRVYGQEQVIPGDFTVGDYFISPEKYQKMKRYSVAPGDVLISCVGSFGKVAVVPRNVYPGIINPRLLRLRPRREKVIPEYLELMLKSNVGYQQMEREGHGGTMDIINIALLDTLYLPVPSLDEQLAILAGIAKRNIDLDSLKTSYTRQINLLQEYRASLIHECVTGQRDLRDFALPAAPANE